MLRDDPTGGTNGVGSQDPFDVVKTLVCGSERSDVPVVAVVVVAVFGGGLS